MSLTKVLWLGVLDTLLFTHNEIRRFKAPLYNVSLSFDYVNWSCRRITSKITNKVVPRRLEVSRKQSWFLPRKFNFLSGILQYLNEVENFFSNKKCKETPVIKPSGFRLDVPELYYLQKYSEGMVSVSRLLMPRLWS